MYVRKIRITFYYKTSFWIRYTWSFTLKNSIIQMKVWNILNINHTALIFFSYYLLHKFLLNLWFSVLWILSIKENDEKSYYLNPKIDALHDFKRKINAACPSLQLWNVREYWKKARENMKKAQPMSVKTLYNLSKSHTTY